MVVIEHYPFDAHVALREPAHRAPLKGAGSLAAFVCQDIDVGVASEVVRGHVHELEALPLRAEGATSRDPVTRILGRTASTPLAQARRNTKCVEFAKLADRNQLLRLSRGVAAWNKWRLTHPFVAPDLLDADLTLYSLSRRVPDDLPEDADTTIVVFSPGADFTRGSLDGISAKGKQIVGADFTNARLRQADFRNAHLWDCDFTQADLEDADLTGAWIRNSVFAETTLWRASFTDVTLSSCMFADVDLAEVRGLESIIHQSPSTIGVDTLYRSAGNIPAKFLSGCGIPAQLLEYLPSFIGPDDVIRFYSCFISYSSTDQEFAEKLYIDLKRLAVRCWLASEDMKIGDRIRTRIDDAIRVYDKLLLVLSEASLRSQWVEQEVESALEKERLEQRTVLFPIRLDDAVMQPVSGWPSLVRNTRHIGDFRDWRNRESYKRAFERLKRDAKVE